MKSLLTKIALQKAIGVYLGEQEIAVSQVAVTPLGPREVARHLEPWSGEDPATALPKALEAFLPEKRRRWPTAVGLPASRLFLATRPFRSGNEATPEGLLQHALCSPSIRVDDYIVDVTKAEIGRSPLVSVVACRKKYLTAVMAGLTECKLRPVRTEPGPCGLVRAAAHQYRTPRRVKIALRVFLNDGQGLAVLVAGELPVAWRNFPLPAGQEVASILRVARTLQSLEHSYGIETPLKVLMLHGRTDLHAQLEEPTFAEETGMRVICCPGPALDPAGMAFGLALGCLAPNASGCDLSRSLKPKASFRELLPVGDLVLESLLILCMAWLLWTRSEQVEEACLAVHTDNLMHKCLASGSREKLEKEKKDLEERVGAVRQFLDTRMQWTSYTHDVAARLPVNAKLNTFHGFYEIEGLGKKKDSDAKPKKSLVIKAVAPVADNGSMPREIDSFLGSLRNHPLLQRDFPQVELADIKRTQDVKTMRWLANFTVVCLPKSTKGQAPAAAGGNSDPNKKGGPMKPTDDDKDKPSAQARLLEELRNPQRFRAVVMALVLLAGYLFVYAPLSDQIDQSARKLKSERHLSDLARGIEHLRTQFHTFEDRLPKQTDTKEWVAYVLNGVRKFPLRLVTLDCETPRALGPYRAVVLRIELEGSFLDMDGFLRWLETNERLFRTEVLRIAPSTGNKNVLSMQLTVLGIMG